MTAGQKGAVAAGHRLTAKAAGDILQNGGNAMDAAIAAAWMSCVCEPVLASPGGGGFAMTHSPGGATRLVDFFAQTPLQKNLAAYDFREIHADFGTTTQSFHIGHASTATPGLVPGLFHLHFSGASLPMDALLAPAIQTARNGLTVTPFQHLLSTIVSPILLANTSSRKLFAPDGALIAAGEQFSNPELGDLFELLAIHGLSGYSNEFIPAIAGNLKDNGHLTTADFTQYEVEERAPLTIQFHDFAIHLNPLPSAGGTLIAHTLPAAASLTPLSLAQALDRTDLERNDRHSALFAELQSAGTQSYRGTTHISVMDAAGNACAMTLSNGEGNGEVIGNFGVMPNNMLGESDVNPNGALGWQEDCRLSSIMCPVVVERSNGDLIALGSGGSNRIRSAISAVLCQLAGSSDTLEQAVNAPRMHIEASHLDVEGQFDTASLDSLTGAFRDHRIWEEPNMFFGGCHAVKRAANGALAGAGDARRDGVAIIV